MITVDIYLQLKRTAEELNSAIEAKEELMQRCHELDLQVCWMGVGLW